MLRHQRIRPRLSRLCAVRCMTKQQTKRECISYCGHARSMCSVVTAAAIQVLMLNMHRNNTLLAVY
jgi:hypothetical protein